MKILCLGNEFIKEDSLAKKIASELNEFDFINIKDSFQLIEYFNKHNQEEIIILDVVEDILNVRELSIEDLKLNSILSAHDFDASFFIQLLEPKIRIIGIPQEGDIEIIKENVIEMLKRD